MVRNVRYNTLNEVMYYHMNHRTIHKNIIHIIYSVQLCSIVENFNTKVLILWPQMSSGCVMNSFSDDSESKK